MKLSKRIKIKVAPSRADLIAARLRNIIDENEKHPSDVYTRALLAGREAGRFRQSDFPQWVEFLTQSAPLA